jgi:spermidine/putrescine transport system substrate-binding protein
MMTISRRTLMQMMGAGAGALAMPFVKNSKAFAAREKEMNILCWEGYNSGHVLDPFRKKEGVATDPAAVGKANPSEAAMHFLASVPPALVASACAQ